MKIELQQLIRERHGGKCVYCGRDGDVVDHVLPRSKGGTDVMYNLVWCCTECNQQKYNRSVSEFLWLIRFHRRNVNLAFRAISPMADKSVRRREGDWMRCREWLLVYSPDQAAELARRAAL